MLELLSDFFTADHAARTKLGAHLADRRGEHDANDTTAHAALVLAELNDAAELLHALAGDFHPRTTRHH